MVDKCKSCEAKIVKFPLWKDQEHGEKFEFNKIIWKNIFKMDWYSVILILVVIFMFWTYKHDIERCAEMINDPCGYCEKTNCCRYLADKNLIVPDEYDEYMVRQPILDGLIYINSSYT